MICEYIIQQSQWEHTNADHIHPQLMCSKTHAGCKKQSKQAVSEWGSAEKSIWLVSSSSGGSSGVAVQWTNGNKVKKKRRKIEKSLHSGLPCLLLNESLTGMWQTNPQRNKDPSNAIKLTFWTEKNATETNYRLKTTRQGLLVKYIVILNIEVLCNSRRSRRI